MRYLLTHGLLAAAERQPEREAVRISDRSLTYAELADQSLRLAHVLCSQGVRRGDRVGIYTGKSLEMVVAVYAALLAGAAYVPLDPFAPPERIRFVLQDCGIREVIAAPARQESIRYALTNGVALRTVVGLGEAVEGPVTALTWNEVLSAPAHVPGVPPIEQDLAYILYTSGSTGAPKGIMHTHRSGLSFAEWAAHTYALVGEDRVSNHAPLHFDLSTFDLFATGIAGATLVLIPEAITKFPASLAKLIETERLSVWYSVPFALIQLLLRGGLESRDLSALRWVLFAGEPFPTKHLRDLMGRLPHARFSNLYGPTETNVCTYYHVAPLSGASDEPIPIGRPCANTDALIVNGDDQPVAAGEIGELLIRSPLVMQGYWGRPDLSARGFLRRSSAGDLEAVYYRTGDLVQELPGGDLKYLGRKDRQVKTRGYRVELDEVETALLSHAHVQEAAVYTIPDGEGSHLIAAAVTPESGRQPTAAQLRDHLAGRLPPYAIPVRLDILSEFPRTSTGKIDRRALQTQAMPA